MIASSDWRPGLQVAALGLASNLLDNLYADLEKNLRVKLSVNLGANLLVNLGDNFVRNLRVVLEKNS